MNDDVKGEALYNDNRVHDIAAYACTEGYTKGSHPKNIKRKFVEFKKLIKTGEFSSIDELEESIYLRFGILGVDNHSGICKDDIQHLKDMHDEFEKRDEKKRISKNNEEDT